MSTQFLISDTHWNHENILTFLKADGSRLREFASIEEHDEYMVDNWNRVVKSGDVVVHVGDVVLAKGGLKVRQEAYRRTIGRCNGRKKLIRGNHDRDTMKEYGVYFESIHGSRKIDNFIVSHYPIHPESIPAWCPANLHGHLHDHRVMRTTGWQNSVTEIDPRYFGLAVELINYTPISLEDVKARVKAQQEPT